MAFKLLVLMYSLQVLAIYAQNSDDYYPSMKDVSGPFDLDNCNETQCNPPCPGAMPPKQCPANIPPCHFGCACHTDCDLGVVFCFQTKDCLERRRFTRRRRIKA